MEDSSRLKLSSRFALVCISCVELCEMPLVALVNAEVTQSDIVPFAAHEKTIREAVLPRLSITKR